MIRTKKVFTISLAIFALAILGVVVIIAVFGFKQADTNPTSDSSDLIEKTYCSDVCPQNTRSFKVYKGVDSQEACDTIGGQTISDAAWGAYIGCQPRPVGEPSKIRA